MIQSHKFELGDTVFLKLDSEDAGMVTGVLVRPNGVTYAVSWSNDKTERWHYAIELTDERSFGTESR